MVRLKCVMVVFVFLQSLRINPTLFAFYAPIFLFMTQMWLGFVWCWGFWGQSGAETFGVFERLIGYGWNIFLVFQFFCEHKFDPRFKTPFLKGDKMNSACTPNKNVQLKVVRAKVAIGARSKKQQCLDLPQQAHQSAGECFDAAF